jgi:RNA:NAD 2'-phosphotransferase (TPT1/KptA family)
MNPPRFLYHGTTAERAKAIETSGLRPSSRDAPKGLIFLSPSQRTAFEEAADAAYERDEPSENIVVFRVKSKDLDPAALKLDLFSDDEELEEFKECVYSKTIPADKLKRV